MDPIPLCPVCHQPIIAGAPQGLCPECLLKSGLDTKTGNEPEGSQPPFVPRSVEAIAKLFPQIEVIELLGHGGMGAVYKARQPRLNRFVALKILSPEKQNDPQFAERFEREARALASLTHPNIVTVYDFGETQGTFYLLMEFVDGLSLRQLYQARELLPAEALVIIPKICEALQYAHEQGIVHRDIKPENILLDKSGRVKIADFGIAKILDLGPGNLSLTGVKEVVGTPHYMAPEQLEKPQTVDARADIYSLGVVFYEMLTRELPIGKFQLPSQKVHVDVRLDEVVLHALEKEPERRYQTATQMKTDVDTIAATPEPAAPPIYQDVPPIIPISPMIPTSNGVKTSSGLKMVALVGGLGLVALIALFCLSAWMIKKKRTAVPTMAATQKVSSNDFTSLLNDDQRLIAQYGERKYKKFFEARTFEGWSESERASFERKLIDVIKGPHSDEYYQAINTLGALHSVNALPLLREMAFDHRQTIVRLESSNRHRWMAVRAMSMIDDQTSVPRLIHLLYHNNVSVRLWTQISLVRMTGQNFGNDWKAWGNWWNSQHKQPPFNPEVIHWWNHQPPPDELATSLPEEDRKYVANIRNKNPSHDDEQIDSSTLKSLQK